MKKFEINWYFILGVVLLVAGMVIPLLIVIKVLESTFLLNFLSFFASVAGMVIGFIAIGMYIQGNRRR